MNLRHFRYYTAWHHVANEWEYVAPADPWKLLRVNPTDVEYYTDEFRLNWGLGRVAGGRWDCEERRDRLRETTLYTGLEQRFGDGYDWRETALYQWAKEQFESGGTVRGYDSLSAYRTVRCEYLDALFREIGRDGYRPNAEATHEPATQNNPYEHAYAHHLEPLVVVGRTGDVLVTEGYHRLVIAAILDLDEIPVQVLCRHEQWQRVRDRIYDAPVDELPPELETHLDHPDLRDVRL